MSVEVEDTQIALLSERLGSLLGFSDGVDDVVRNLLTIESRPVRGPVFSLGFAMQMCAACLMLLSYYVQDLLDYLTQLLGSDRQDQLRDFVDDVCRVQRGEVLPEPNVTAPVIVEQKKITPKLEKDFKKKSTPKLAAAAEQKPLKKAAPTVVARSEKTPPKKAAPKAATAVVQLQAPPTTSRPAPPQQGQASVVCGCFGTTHPALTNCLHCGRISCAREGYDYCAFCGYLVLEKFTRRENNDMIDAAAWELQERLLGYDRQFAQRTVVVDDQADYYATQATSTWLNDSEQQEAAQREVQRHNAMHHRQKMTLDLDV
jgi:Putative zinc finger motif, C2HC5-type